MRLIVAGAGSHASVVVDVARIALPGCEVIGLLDDSIAVGTLVSGVAVLGRIADIDQFPHDAVAVAIGDNVARARIHDRLQASGESLPTLVHPTAAVASSASLGAGTVVLAHAVVNAEAVIEEDVIVNTAATVDHHTHIGPHAHLAPGVHVAGRCRIGEGTALGIGSVVAPAVTVGARTIVGAGSVVLRDLPSDVIAYGSPARVIRQRTANDSFH